jgi:VWFA-related protein
MLSAVAAVSLGLWSASAAAGTPSPESLPGVETEVVRLDAVVTDRDGRLVRTLAQEDFELREDGKPQRLTHFLVVSRPPRASAPPAAEGAPLAAAAPLAESAAAPSRQIVVLVDDLHIAAGNLQYTKAALGRFVDEFVLPEDNLALLATSSPGGTQAFTRDRALLKQAIGSLTVRDATGAPMAGSQMTPAQAELVLRGDRAALRLAARSFLDDPGSPLTDVGVRAAALADRGHVPADLDPKEAVAADEALRQARGLLAEALRFSVVTLDRLDDVVRGLATLPGRKICLLVSDGFLVGSGTQFERTRELRQVIDAATRSGTVVYALDARGLVTMSTDASATVRAASAALQQLVTRQTEQLFLGTLASVAADTGGFLVHGTNDLAGGLRRMMEDNDAYYLMAYEPTNQKRDGRFRRIDLRLPGHPDFSVRTRKGYLAPGGRGQSPKAEAQAAVASSAASQDETPAALGGLIPANGVPVQLTVDYLDLPPSGPQIVARAHVDVASLTWTESDGRHRASLDLLGALYDAVGDPVGSPFGTSRQLEVTPSELSSLRQLGLQYQQRLAVKPGRYRMRLVVRGPDGAPLGGSERWVEIPDLGEKKLALSSVFLSATRQETAAGAQDMRDAHTLRRFRSRDQLYFQFYIYNAHTDERGVSDVVFQAQIWSGARVVAASKPKPAALQMNGGAPLPETNGMALAGIAPGRYELRVVVVDRTASASVSRNVDFTIE